jgi:hypothetical protein
MIEPRLQLDTGSTNLWENGLQSTWQWKIGERMGLTTEHLEADVTCPTIGHREKTDGML